jgi:oxaloacetate decarboxylase gamma subunit
VYAGSIGVEFKRILCKDNHYGGPMTIGDMLELGGLYTVLGIGIIAAIAASVVVAFYIAGKPVNAPNADKNAAFSPMSHLRAGSPANAGSNNAIMAAITAAVSEYRKTKKHF